MKKLNLLSTLTLLTLSVFLAGCGEKVNSEQLERSNQQAEDISKKSDEQKIEEAIYRNFPNWEKGTLSEIKMKKEQRGFAYGTYIQGSDQVELNWFAYKIDKDNWSVIEPNPNVSLTCQLFQEKGFPSELTPDCRDSEKMRVVYTKNPELFFGEEFNDEDREEIIEDFLSFMKNNHPEYLNSYENKKEGLSVGGELMQNKYFRGAVTVNGVITLSAPSIIAVKINDSWKVLYWGQDCPDFSVVNRYKIPKEMTIGCFYEDGDILE